MNKKIFIILFTVLTLAGCNKEEADNPETNNDRITFNIGFTNTGFAEKTTRMETDMAFESRWEAGDEIGMIAVPTGGSLSNNRWIDNVKFTFDGTQWMAESPLYWPNDGTKLDFYAYYPYSTEVTGGTTVLRYAYQSSYNNLMRAKADNSGTGYSKGMIVALEFTHSLAMVQVTVDNGNDVLVMENTKVTLDGVYTAGNFDLESNVMTPSGELKSITMECLDDMEGADNARDFTYRALVPEQMVEAGQSVFRIADDNFIFSSTPLDAELELLTGQAEIFWQHIMIDDYLPLLTNTFFRSHCKLRYDTNGDGKLSPDEVLSVTTLDVSNNIRINTLKGIKYFRNIQTLKCIKTPVSTLDISNNDLLQEIYCGYGSSNTVTILVNPDKALGAAQNALRVFAASDSSGLNFEAITQKGVQVHGVTVQDK